MGDLEPEGDLEISNSILLNMVASMVFERIVWW